MSDKPKLEIVKDPSAPAFKNPETSGLPEGELMCHRMYIPSTIVAPGPTNSLTRQPTIEVKQNLAYTKCIKEKCALYHVAAQKCGDWLVADHAFAMRNDVMIPDGLKS